MATLLKANGARTEIFPAKGKKFKLEELQAQVGGYIELVALAPGNGRKKMVINEEGKMMGLPRNPEATKLMHPGHMAGDFISGDALLLEPGEM